MKRKPTANPSSLFLLELIFTILFFSVASAVCVQIFVKSHTLSTQAHDLTQASRRAGDVAELITASTSPDDMKNLLEDAYSDAVNIASENFTIFYDSDFTIYLYCPQSNFSYFYLVNLWLPYNIKK